MWQSGDYAIQERGEGRHWRLKAQIGSKGVGYGAVIKRVQDQEKNCLRQETTQPPGKLMGMIPSPGRKGKRSMAGLE